MPLGLTKEDAEFVADAIILCCKTLGIDMVEALYPDIDLKSILTQLDIIKEIGVSTKED